MEPSLQRENNTSVTCASSSRLHQGILRFETHQGTLHAVLYSLAYSIRTQTDGKVSCPPWTEWCPPDFSAHFSHRGVNDSACEDVFAVRPKPVPSLPTKTSSFWGALRPGKSAILVAWPSIAIEGCPSSGRSHGTRLSKSPIS